LLEESTMAERATGKAQGRSRPAQSKNQGRSGQGKQNPDAGRGGGGGGRNAANGSSARKNREESQQQSRLRSQGQQGEQEESQQSGGAGGKVAEQIKQHPITATAIGAGLALLAAQGLRKAVGNRAGADETEDQDESAEGSYGEEEEGEEDQGAEGEEAQGEEGEGGGFTGRLGRLGSRLGSAFSGSGNAIRRGAQSGFARGREAASESWATHPLLLCGVALGAGLAAGFLLPSSRQEDRLMGKASDKVTGRLKKGGQEFFRQGRQIAGKVVREAVTTTTESAEREGLTPDRLGKKVKKVLSNVRDAVSEAVQED
jgi:hypothetical protein